MLAGIALTVFNRHLARLFDREKAAIVSRIILFLAFILIILGGAMLMKDRPYYG